MFFSNREYIHFPRKTGQLPILPECPTSDRWPSGVAGSNKKSTQWRIQVTRATTTYSTSTNTSTNTNSTNTRSSPTTNSTSTRTSTTTNSTSTSGARPNVV